jgi:hypothetical protein
VRAELLVERRQQHCSPSSCTRSWVGAFAAALHRGEGGAHVNFLGAEGEARILEAHPCSTFELLAEIKARYDPTNLLRLDQNIPPATEQKTGDSGCISSRIEPGNSREEISSTEEGER